MLWAFPLHRGKKDEDTNTNAKDYYAFMAKRLEGLAGLPGLRLGLVRFLPLPTVCHCAD